MQAVLTHTTTPPCDGETQPLFHSAQQSERGAAPGNRSSNYTANESAQANPALSITHIGLLFPLRLSLANEKSGWLVYMSLPVRALGSSVTIFLGFLLAAVRT